jgi:threonine aldolase
VFLASAYTGISPTQYAALFDTVYVSLYKYFNAPFGAVLAAPAALIERVHTLRHQLGGLIYHGWAEAAIALHFYNGFSERYRSAVRNADKLFHVLEASGKVQIEKLDRGSNIFNLRVVSGTCDLLQQRLSEAGIFLRAAKGSATAMLQVNETLKRRPAEEMAQEFLRALA